jgi:hypothetical protein
MKKYLLSILTLSILSCDLLENNIGNVSIYSEPSDYQIKKMIEYDSRYSEVYYFLKETKETKFWKYIATERLVMLEFEDKVNYKSLLSWLYEQGCIDMGDYGYDKTAFKYGKENNYLPPVPSYSYMDIKSEARVVWPVSFKSVKEYNDSQRGNRYYKYENFQDPKFQSYIFNNDYIVENEDSKIFEQFLTKTTNLADDLNYYQENFAFRYRNLEIFVEDKFCETD